MLRIIPRLLWAGATSLVLGACRDAKIMNCKVSEMPTSNPYQLDWAGYVPADCPVPLGQPGELKTVGADVFDKGTQEFFFIEVVVRNGDGQIPPGTGHNGLANTIQQFFGDKAAPRLEYAAATAGYIDRGSFEVLRQNFGQYADDPRATLEITYTSSHMATIIQGTTVPQSNTTQMWTAGVSGGASPYTYAWYRDGTLVSTGYSYTGAVGTTNFGLKLHVTDHTQSTRVVEMRTQVDGVLTSMSGPTLVYSSRGGGTWTASGEGGYPPYTFDWYVDGVHRGNGSSWTGYPGEGEKELWVDMRDTRGTTTRANTYVQGIGNETCEPVPPAVAC
jgi:hypothetical protein